MTSQPRNRCFPPFAVGNLSDCGLVVFILINNSEILFVFIVKHFHKHMLGRLDFFSECFFSKHRLLTHSWLAPCWLKAPDSNFTFKLMANHWSSHTCASHRYWIYLLLFNYLLVDIVLKSEHVLVHGYSIILNNNYNNDSFCKSWS